MWEPYNSYEEKARSIIDKIRYMVLATSDKMGNPWASPVFFAVDEKYNFYFLSAIDSRHGINIEKNPKVGIAIFDSTNPMGSSDGVQLEATVSIIGKKDIAKTIDIYCKRLFPNSKIASTDLYEPSRYVEPSEFRFYKVEPIAVYVNGVERREKVDLNKR
ncbi:MAG: pyridoxamine 5'-phosphate oxidase family protein [Candidatus Micrarchaeales archaeon]